MCPHINIVNGRMYICSSKILFTLQGRKRRRDICAWIDIAAGSTEATAFSSLFPRLLLLGGKVQVNNSLLSILPSSLRAVVKDVLAFREVFMFFNCLRYS